MPAIPFVTCDVFTAERFGGNQLAVFPDATAIPEPLLPVIAREFNFSETTFVYPPADARHARRVRIFTPASELPFAGHPTVGTAVVLAERGDIAVQGAGTRIVFEEGVGPIPVTIRATSGRADWAMLSVARLPEFLPPPPDAAALAACVGLDESEIVTDRFRPDAVSCGVPFLFVPVRNAAALRRARPRVDEFERVLRPYGVPDVFLFCDGRERGADVDYSARMFAPLLGVPEDPATGSACAAFGGYLAARDDRRDGTLRWIVSQGVEMGRPSRLEIEVDRSAGSTVAVRVGGHAVIVTRGEILLQEGNGERKRREETA